MEGGGNRVVRYKASAHPQTCMHLRLIPVDPTSREGGLKEHVRAESLSLRYFRSVADLPAELCFLVCAPPVHDTSASSLQCITHLWIHSILDAGKDTPVGY